MNFFFPIFHKLNAYNITIDCRHFYMNLFPQNVLDFDDRCFKNITMFDYIIYTTRRHEKRKKQKAKKKRKILFAQTERDRESEKNFLRNKNAVCNNVYTFYIYCIVWMVFTP